MKAGCVEKVGNEDELRNAFRNVMSNAKKTTNNINGIIIQPVLSGFEAIAGIKKDAAFGHVIMFGSGGSMAETINDVSFRLIPINEKDAASMINETKAGRFANGYVVESLLKLSELAEENSNIKELDINPLIINNNGVIAADIRIIV